MIVDISEEEREFLERICKQAELHISLRLSTSKTYIDDMQKIRALIHKFKKEKYIDER